MSAPIMTSRFRRSMLICPVCGETGFIRNSERISDMVSDLYVHCSNTFCGQTWKADLSFQYVITPSRLPHDHLNLPQPPPGWRPPIIRRGDPPDPDQITIFDMMDDQPAT